MIAIQTVASMAGAIKSRDEAANVARASVADATAAQNELTRQQGEVNDQAREARSDRIRQAEADLARARVSAAEGFGNLHREIAELGYVEGLDLSRIEGNRAGKIAALQADKNTVVRNSTAQRDSAQRQSDSALMLGLMQAGSAGVQIYSHQKYLDAAEKRAQNTKGP